MHFVSISWKMALIYTHNRRKIFQEQEISKLSLWASQHINLQFWVDRCYLRFECIFVHDDGPQESVIGFPSSCKICMHACYHVEKCTIELSDLAVQAFDAPRSQQECSILFATHWNPSAHCSKAQAQSNELHIGNIQDTLILLSKSSWMIDTLSTKPSRLAAP